MPSRLIREGILTSDRVNQLSAEAEVFYRRLMSKVDDHGLFDARPNVLVASLYPLRRETTENKCLQLLAECIKSNLVKVYEVGGKRFLQMIDTRWKVRSEPKFPPPESADSVISCEQLFTTVDLDVVVVVNEDVVVDVGKTSLRSEREVKGVLTETPSMPNLTPVATATSEAFEAFWRAYPRKVSKGDAEKAWAKAKVDQDLRVRIMAKLNLLKKSPQWLKEGGQYVPYPASWLNAKGWEDEVGPPAVGGMPAAAVEYLRRQDQPTEREIPGERVG